MNNASMPWRVALIGCGRIGSENADDPKIKGIYSHAGAYAVNAQTQLVAVCDADADRAVRCARRWSVANSYTDLTTLLEKEKPQIVSVCTPDASHAAVLHAVLSCDSIQGVFAEKPLALNLAEAEALSQLAARRGVVLAVNYFRRYANGHRRIAAEISRGAIGQVRSVTGMYTGGVIHNGSHWFDLVRWLVGEVKTVYGRATRETSVTANVDPNLDVVLEFANGARGYLCGYDPAVYSVFEMDIVGTAGRVRITDAGHVIKLAEVADSTYYSGYQVLRDTTEKDGGLNQAMVTAVEDLVECMGSKCKPYCDASDGVAALRIAQAVCESAQANNPVSLHC